MNARVGWCPGALRPMQSGDGWLVRLRRTAGVLSLEHARAIADLARRHGNGLIDLSSRANLQIRGLTEASLAPLTAELRALGLLDGNADAEAVRKVVVSPLAGLDPSAVLDALPLAQALEARLAAHAGLHRLPAKFGFLIDDGGAFGLADVDADIRFEAFELDPPSLRAEGEAIQGPTYAGPWVASPSARTDGGAMLAVRLGGDAEVAGVCPPHEVADVATRVALMFLSLRGDGDEAPRRMRDLIARDGREAIVAAAALDPPIKYDACPRTDLAAIIGAHPLGEAYFLGVAAPFGRLHADDLDALASAARQAGARELRLTPWRALLAVGLARDAAAAMGRALAPADLILDPNDPRLAVAACAGAPACRSASTRVHEDAAMFAPLLASLKGGVALHVSGCAKGCARRAATRFTLVGDDGLYNLVENAGAGAAPALRGLTPRDAYATLARRIAETPA